MDTLIASKNWKRIFPLLMSIIIVVIVSLSSCKKPLPEPDYRDKWIGSYEFTTIDYYEYTIYQHPTILIIDTINFIGNIEKYGTDRLKITFMPNATNPFPINGLIYSVVEYSGLLRGPECDSLSSSSDIYLYLFSGSISENEININYKDKYGQGGPLGLKYEKKLTIQGIKMK